MSLILLTSMIAVSMPQQAFATDTNITFIDNGDSFTVTIISTEGIASIVIETAKRGDPVGKGDFACIPSFSQSFPLPREGVTITVVDCTTPTSITTTETFGGGTGGNGGSGGGGTERVDVCHNGKTITVSEQSLKGHLKHGDTEGACP